MPPLPPNIDILLHSIEQILEMIRTRETNTLFFFAGLVAINAAVAGWLLHNDRWRQQRLPKLFTSMIMANIVVAVGFGATGYEYYQWREQLAYLQTQVPGLVLPAGFFHIGMAAVYVLAAVVFALLWAWGAKQTRLHSQPVVGT
jgi:hypothetical protein